MLPAEPPAAPHGGTILTSETMAGESPRGIVAFRSTRGTKEQSLLPAADIGLHAEAAQQAIEALSLNGGVRGGGGNTASVSPQYFHEVASCGGDLPLLDSLRPSEIREALAFSGRMPTTSGGRSPTSILVTENAPEA